MNKQHNRSQSLVVKWLDLPTYDYSQNNYLSFYKYLPYTTYTVYVKTIFFN